MNKRTGRYFSSLGILALAACSVGANDAGGLEPGGLSGGSAGSPGSAGTSPAVSAGSAGMGGAGGSMNSGLAGNFVIDPTLNGTAGTMMVPEDEATCGTGEANAALKPVTMFIMYDRSWSMTACADPALAPNGGVMTQGSLACTDGVSPSRWDLTSSALTQFFQAPEAADLQVALRFFPDDVPGCTGYADTGFGVGMGDPTLMPNCDVSICAQPLVDTGVLSADPAPADAHEGALVAAVVAGTPPGPTMPNPNPATPTFAALGGAEEWAIQRQAAFPNEQTVVVLVTDGEPFGCDTNVDNIAQLARDAYEDAGILTYVIGLTGASEAQLNQLAASGGTDQAYFVADGSTATQELLDALLAIRGMPIACDFAVPTSTATGDEIDPHLINVNYTSSAGTETELGLVSDAASCGNEQAWYYDNPDMPARIILCPAACATVTADSLAQITILAGCKPRIVDPK